MSKTSSGITSLRWKVLCWPCFGFNLLIGLWNYPKPWRNAQKAKAAATSAVEADLSHSGPELPLHQKVPWVMWEEGMSPVKDSTGRLLFGDLLTPEMKRERLQAQAARQP